MKIESWATLCITACALASPAFADPCEAERPKKAGATFAGVVRYVGDGDSLCVGRTDDPKEWIEVRIEDFDAPELDSPLGRKSKKFLEDISMGRPVACTVMRGRSGSTTSWDRVFAKCLIGGVSIGDLLRSAGAPMG